jgi:hypothetical protein
MNSNLGGPGLGAPPQPTPQEALPTNNLMTMFKSLVSSQQHQAPSQSAPSGDTHTSSDNRFAPLGKPKEKKEEKHTESNLRCLLGEDDDDCGV